MAEFARVKAKIDTNYLFTKLTTSEKAPLGLNERSPAPGEKKQMGIGYSMCMAARDAA